MTRPCAKLGSLHADLTPPNKSICKIIKTKLKKKHLKQIKVLLSEIISTHWKIVVLGNQTYFRLMAYWNIISKIPNNYKVMEGFIKGRRMDEDHSKTNYFNHTRVSNFEIEVVKMGIGCRPNFLKVFETKSLNELY